MKRLESGRFLRYYTDCARPRPVSLKRSLKFPETFSKVRLSIVSIDADWSRFEGRRMTCASWQSDGSARHPSTINPLFHAKEDDV